MRRWLLSLALGLGFLVIAFGLWSWQNRPRDVTALIGGQQPQPGAARATEIAQGSLAERYLLPPELKQLHLKLDLEHVRYLKDLNEKRWGLACERGINCIPDIVQPRFETVIQAEDWLGDGDLVISVRYNHVVKAYPLRIMAWHQILNDYFGNTPIVLVYSPFTGAGLAFVRPELQGKPLEFGISGRLYNADVLLYDRQTGTFWQGFTGKPLAGPLVGIFSGLKQIPSEIVAWGTWKNEHPGGQVLARPRRIAVRNRRYKAALQRYDEYPYAEYELRRWVGYGVDVDQLKLQGLPPKRRVVGLTVGGSAIAYLKSELSSHQVLNTELAGEPIAVLHAPDGELRAFLRRLPSGQVVQLRRVNSYLVAEGTGDRWDLEGMPLSAKTELKRLVTTPCYWFAWVLFHPQTDLFPSPG